MRASLEGDRSSEAGTLSLWRRSLVRVQPDAFLILPTLFMSSNEPAKGGVLGVDLVYQPTGDFDARLSSDLRLTLALRDDVSGD